MGWAPPPIPGRLSLDGEPPFVGRRAELEILEHAWEAVEAGRRQVVFVGGEPGAGKTRLVAEVASALNQKGIGVLLGTSFVDYGAPYQPFVECLDHLFRAAPYVDLTELVPDSAKHLIRVCPRITAHRPDLEPIEVPTDDRGELFTAFRDLFQSLSGEQPLALILEDTHWALEPTRQLLLYLVQAIDKSALLVLVTYRTTDPDRSYELTRVIADLYRLPGVNRIDLAGLGVADITRYVMAWRDTAVAEARRTAVVLRDQTGGNPFFIKELLTQGGSGPLDAGLAPPSTVLDALGARLDALSSPAISVIELAATVGDEFDSMTLVFADGDPDRVLDALDEASKAGLVASDPGTDSARYRFEHSLTREAVIGRMSSSRRAEAHAAIAGAVESVWPDTGGRHAVLAYHFRGARIIGFAPRAVQHALLAAGHAEASLAYEDAASWFRGAAELDDGPRRDQWLLAAAQNMVRAGDFSSAIRMYADLTDSGNPRWAAEAAVGFEDASWRRGINGSACVAVLDRALGRIDEDPHDPLYVLLLSRKARAMFYAGRPEAGELSDRAISLATDIGDPSLIGTTLGASVNQILVPGRIDELIGRSRKFLEWAKLAGSHDETAHAAGLLVNLTYMSGDRTTLDESRALFDEAIEAGGLTYWRFLRDEMAYADSFVRGDLETASEIANESLRAGRLFGPDFPDGPHGVQMFMVERERGRLEAVRHVADSIQDPERLWLPGVLALYAELGFVEKAAHLLELIFENELDSRRASVDWPAVLALVAEAVIAVGDRRLAELWRPALVEYTGLNLFAGSFVAVFGSADRYIAQIDAMLGLDSAEEHFRIALEMDRRMGSTLHEVETMAAYASYLDRSTDHRRLALATQYRKRARSIAERKGLVRQLRRLDQATTIRSDRPAGLTPREVDVLRLIAQGLSNKEIAERLFISQNTAANHIRRILTKTQATNRTKAAIFAAENGLLS